MSLNNTLNIMKKRKIAVKKLLHMHALSRRKEPKVWKITVMKKFKIVRPCSSSIKTQSQHEVTSSGD